MFVNLLLPHLTHNVFSLGFYGSYFGVCVEILDFLWFLEFWIVKLLWEDWGFLLLYPRSMINLNGRLNSAMLGVFLDHTSNLNVDSKLEDRLVYVYVFSGKNLSSFLLTKYQVWGGIFPWHHLFWQCFILFCFLEPEKVDFVQRYIIRFPKWMGHTFISSSY